MASGRSPRPTSDGLAGSGMPESSGPVLLLVEDEPRIRDLVARVLRDQAYRVEVAADGDEAVLLSEQLPRVDLLITDVVMPGMSGTEVADLVAARAPEVAVLYISGYSAKAFPETMALPKGMAFLSKPFTVSQLLEKVDLLLRVAQGSAS